MNRKSEAQMVWLFEILNFFEWMEPRRRDDPYTAECRRATRQAFCGTVSLLVLLALGWLVSSMLDNVGRVGPFALVAATLREYTGWAFLALHAFFTLQVCAGCWALYKVYYGRWEPRD